MFQEYPKSLYRGSVDDEIIVKDADSESQARANGYEMFAEIHERGESTEVEAPKKRGRPAKAE
jgi:hypothetical protein